MFEGMFEIFNEKKEEGGEETEISYPDSASQPSYSAPSNVFVVSVGGSILLNGKPNSEAIAEISECFNELIRQGHKLVLVVGGGKVARDYVDAARALGANNFELDELGIKITRANASLLLPAIENAHQSILTDVKQSAEVLAQGKTPIYGGLMPGFTTDAVAALLAEYLNAAFINLSNVDGIFTADPAAHPSARLYRELDYDRLLEILIGNAMKPSQNLILDLPAAMILKRSNITAYFLNGHDLQNFKAAVQGMSFHGTIVRAGASELLEGDNEESFQEKRSCKRKAPKRKTAKKGKTKRIPRDDGPLDPDEIDF